MKPILMIHAVCDDMFNLPLEDYVLTFDDGLYSQFAYLDKFLAIPTDKIFFISTNILCVGNQSAAFPASHIAHEKAMLQGNTEDFMTIAQVRQIINSPRCFVGGHGHNHLRLAKFPSKVGVIKAIKQDTEQMLDCFSTVFGLKPTKFCFPYNYDAGGMYPALLKTYGFTEFYGRERIPVETLLRS